VTSELLQDGTVIFSTLAEPAYGLGRAVARRRALSVVVLSTALSLLATGLILPTFDVEAVAGEQLRPDMTPHEREQAIEAATKLNEVTTWAIAGVRPPASALGLSLVLWLAFLAAGARSGFKPTFTVAAHALLPQALKALLTVPAALAHAPVRPDQLAQLLPSCLAAWLPASLGLPPLALAAASALDLFTLWSVVLVSSGMKKASGASPLRTWVVVLVLFAAWIAVFKVIPAAGGLSPRGAP
jgi:hypothetical protein